jgi:hypothetical protein
MLRKILEQIDKGAGGPKAIAQNLGMQESAVENGIELLVGKGYLERLASCPKDLPKCAACPLSGKSLPVFLCITKKGLDFLNS